MPRLQTIRIVFIAFTLILVCAGAGHAQNLIVGAALGVQFSIEDNIYMDDPLDFWVDKEWNPA